MFDIDLLIALGFMALLFLRHVAILKKQNKINYAPLMLAIGVIASLIHFMIHPDPSNVILLLRESLMPFLVAMILYLVMNVLNQTKESENAKLHDRFTRVLVEEITQLKEFILELETRMTEYSKEDRAIQQEIQKKFQSDIKSLDAIYSNQLEFTKKFEDLEQWNKNVNDAFKHFAEVQLPELDNVVHKHIDMLRVAEQDHYNKLTKLLEKAVQSRFDIAKEIENLQESLASVKHLSDDISENIVTKTYTKLTTYTKEFEAQILSLKLHSEGLKTTLYEDENILATIRSQSEMIMKQMRLSANKMQELHSEAEKLLLPFHDVALMQQEFEKIKSDYIKAQAELTQISHEIEHKSSVEYEKMQEKIETIAKELTQKLDLSLEKFNEHSKIAHENLTQSVKIMAKKAQLQKEGYDSL
jgi:DNA repair exonuclease SbcCD ATPase subunit